MQSYHQFVEKFTFLIKWKVNEDSISRKYQNMRIEQINKIKFIFLSLITVKFQYF